MAIKIPDNILTKPLYPGGGSDGTENVTRMFGNREEQTVGSPDVPRGWGGVAIENSDLPARAMARAAEQIAQGAVDVVNEIEVLRDAEEDSRAKLMFLEIDKKDAEIRSKLDADPEYAKLSTADQQSRYELERDMFIDDLSASYNFQQRRVAKSVNDGLAQYKARSSIDYQEKVVKPRIVEQAKLNDVKADDLQIAKVAAEPTASNVKAAADDIATRYDSPQAFAIYGAANAYKLKQNAIARLAKTTIDRFEESLLTSPLADIPFDGLITKENMKEGPVYLLIGDETGKLHAMIDQLPMSDDAKLALKEQGNRSIQKFATASINDHNNIIKEKNKARVELANDLIDTADYELSTRARNGTLTSKEITATVNRLSKNAAIAEDPQMLKKLSNMAERADADVRKAKREAAQEARLNAITSELIGLTTQKTTDAAFKKQFQKPYALMDAAERERVNNWMRTANPLELPREIKATLEAGLMSNDPKQVVAASAEMKALANSNPTLLADIDSKARDIYHRVAEGQTPEQAKEAVAKRATTSPDATRQAQQDGRDYLKSKHKIDKDPANHPLQKAFKGAQLAPQAQARWDREYNDALVAGMHPATAEQNATAAVKRSYGESKLMTVDKKPVVSMDAPEVVFRAPTDLIRNDVIASGKEFGFNKDTKFSLQIIPGSAAPSTGKPVYQVQVVGADGIARVAQTESGKPFLYSFDPTNNAEIRSALAKNKEQETIANYNRLVRNAVQTGQMKVNPNEQYLLYGKQASAEEAKKLKSFNQSLWDQAEALSE